MVEIREAKSSDVKSIAKVILECFPNDFVDGKIKNVNIVYAEKWIKERMKCKQFMRYFVAIEDKRIVGFVFHLMIGGLSGVVQLEQIGVLKKYRGRGIGKKLIQTAENFWEKYLVNEYGKPLYKMLLTTSKINDDAHNLYSATGFKYETTMKKIYWNNDEEIWVKEF